MALFAALRGSERRPAIPEALKRQVRQKCGFGCVICGLPLFEYHHIEPYSVVREHTLENLVLLCGTHHTDTKGMLSAEVVRRFAAAPVNKNQLFTASHLRLMAAGGSSQMQIGSDVYDWLFDPKQDGEFVLLTVAGRRLIGVTLEDGFLLLDLCLMDAAGNVVLRVERGHMKVATDVWDYSIVGHDLKINSAPRKIALGMSFTDSGVNIHRAEMPIAPQHVLEIANGVTRFPMRGRSWNLARNRITLRGNRTGAPALDL